MVDSGLAWCLCRFEKCVRTCLRQGYQNDWMMACLGLSLVHDPDPDPDPSLCPFPSQISQT